MAKEFKAVIAAVERLIERIDMKKQPKQALADSVAQDWAHQHTATINSRRRILEFEANEIDRSIVALGAALANQRRRKANIEATLRGLASVVAKR